MALAALGRDLNPKLLAADVQTGCDDDIEALLDGIESVFDSVQGSIEANARTLDANRALLNGVKAAVVDQSRRQQQLASSIRERGPEMDKTLQKIQEAKRAYLSALASFVMLGCSQAVRTPAAAPKPDSLQAREEYLRKQFVKATGHGPEGQGLLACDHSGTAEVTKMDVLEHIGNREYGSAFNDMFGSKNPTEQGQAVQDRIEEIGDGAWGTIVREILESDKFKEIMRDVGKSLTDDSLTEIAPSFTTQ